ncbi:alpha/beta fold hydrolase [Herbidospora sp. NBRC 101105]|uniref:alpha/beta fold hydrolase n=1 Tax=Herbidospora sp. NBRC 101105 TaxID=3032195 RepID=UPI0024A0B036|nr:alpha/beta fold hydrolase [Herbidospora sp. NBRC 101105]GLX93858.1 Ndr family protein [Herbidospora sp. NBRC 101105]
MDIFTSPDAGRALLDRYRDLLDTWPVPAERLTVPTTLGDTFVLASGPPGAPPVILVHGAMANSLTWYGDIAAWSEHHRVYAVDIPGEPGLSAPNRPPIGDYPGWLGEVMTGLGVESATVVGLSLGGWIATGLAVRDPRRVERLALICPGGIGRVRRGLLLVALLLLALGQRKRSQKLILGADLSGTGWFGEFHDRINRDFKPRRTDLRIYTDAELAGLTMPVLVIAGDRDALINGPETARRVRANVPKADVRLLPGVGHLITGQTGTVNEFLG